MGNRLYVGNLSFSTTRETLESAFAAAGEVRRSRCRPTARRGSLRGFAFVTMGSAQAANSAISQLNGAVLDGRALKVNEAQERPARGFGGGGQAVAASAAAAVVELGGGGGGFGGGGGGAAGGRGGPPAAAAAAATGTDRGRGAALVVRCAPAPSGRTRWC